MKLEDLLGTLVESLRENGIEPPVIQKVVEELKAAAEEEKADRAPRGSKSKAQVIVLALDPEGAIAALGDTTALVLTLEADADPLVSIERIKDAAHSFNRGKAGSKNPVQSVSEVFEYVKAKHWKDADHPEKKTRVLTRHPVQIIPVSGRLT